MSVEEDLGQAVSDGRMPEQLPATNTGQAQVATGVYYLGGPGPTQGPSTTATSLPAVGAVATQDVWMEVRIMSAPHAPSSGEQDGGQPGAQLSYYQVAKAGQPYYPPE